MKPLSTQSHRSPCFSSDDLLTHWHVNLFWRVELTSWSPARIRPSPMRLGVLVPDPPVALSGPGGDWMYSVPEPGVSAALPEGYMGAYSWYNRFLSFSSKVFMVLSTNPTLPRPSPSDSLGARGCCEGAGLWGNEGTLPPPTAEKGCCNTTGCWPRSEMDCSCSRAEGTSCSRGGVSGEGC